MSLSLYDVFKLGSGKTNIDKESLDDLELKLREDNSRLAATIISTIDTSQKEDWSENGENFLELLDLIREFDSPTINEFIEPEESIEFNDTDIEDGEISEESEEPEEAEAISTPELKLVKEAETVVTEEPEAYVIIEGPNGEQLAKETLENYLEEAGLFTELQAAALIKEENEKLKVELSKRPQTTATKKPSYTKKEKILLETSIGGIYYTPQIFKIEPKMVLMYFYKDNLPTFIPNISNTKFILRYKDRSMSVQYIGGLFTSPLDEDFTVMTFVRMDTD